MRNDKMNISAIAAPQTLLGMASLLGLAVLCVALFGLQRAHAEDPLLPAVVVPAASTTTVTTTTAAVPSTTAMAVPAAAQPVPVSDNTVPAAATAITTTTTVPPTGLPETTTVTNVASTPGTSITAALPVPAAPVPAVKTAMSAVNIPTPPIDLPPGTPSAVGQVMHDLQQAQQGISVDDMARAQDALQRLDLMLQIQKKVKEYKEAQQDRETATSPFGMPMGAGAGAMPTAIPASALNLPEPGAMPVTTTTIVKTKAPKVTIKTTYEVQQISGTNGNMMAVVISGDGDRKTVRIGDDLDDQQVTNINADGVQLRGAKGITKTISINNNGLPLAPFAR